MKYSGVIMLFVSLFSANLLIAQTPDSIKVETPDTTKTETPVTTVASPDTSANAAKDTSTFQNFFTDEEETKFLDYKPIISLGCGILSFYGEGINKEKSHPAIGRFGFNVGVSKNVNDFLAVGLSATIGKLSGTYKSAEKNFNFQSDIFCGGVNLIYNFGHFLKKEGYMVALNKQYEVLPFASIGLEAVNFNSKGDIKDKDGNPYNYWSDGTVRNIAENSSNSGNSVIVQRDYKYETDLRELNLDKLGRYSETTIAVPVTLGADFIVDDKVTVRLSTTLHYTFSDNIDNISSKGIGLREGTKGKDAFLYTNVSFLFDIFTSEKIVNYDKFLADNPNISDFDKIYYSDEDKDGVNDFDDNCIQTPLGIAVYKNGCPVDCDGDGVPDYLDKEFNTPPGVVVDLAGNPYTEAMMMELAKDTAEVGVDYDMIEKMYPSSNIKTFQSFSDSILPKFKYLDANEDGYISLEEFYNEMDRFFDGNSKMSLEGIYELMDFFFSQDQ